MARPTEEITEKRFNKAAVNIEKALVNYIPVTESGCWLWLGPLTKSGHGTISVLGKTQLIHRISFARANGRMPWGEIIRHKCDVPSCMNPDQLISGTQKDSINDMISRGRGSWQK